MNDDEHSDGGRITVQRHSYRKPEHFRKERRAGKVDQDRGDNVGKTGVTKGNNCATCICDVGQAIEDLKKILIRKTDLLSKISVYDCAKFNDIGNQIVITNANLETLPRHYSEIEETKGRKYIDEEEIESALKRGVGRENDHEILTLAGFNLIIPCNHEGDEFMWTMSITRPNYTWTRSDESSITGYVKKNGALELYDMDAKNSGNYSCIVSYIDPENEEPILNVYTHGVQVVSLPDYILTGGNRYDVNLCDDSEIDALSTYLPQKLNDILCKDDICEAFLFTPHCRRRRVFINTILVPANVAKLVPAGIKACGVRCRKAIQDKVTLLLSRNLRSVLQKPIVFRLPHHQERLVPVLGDNRRRSRSKRGRSKKHKSSESAGEVGLLIGCPAGYSLQDTHCLPCGVGFYSEDGSSYCKKCPAGSHQPNTGSRTCRACVNPFAVGCRDMVWSSSSIIFIIVMTICATVVISIVATLIVICLKRRCQKNSCKPEDSICTVQTCTDEVIPLMAHEKDSTEEGDNSSDSDNKKVRDIKAKSKKRCEDRKLERNFVLVDRNELHKSEKEGKTKHKRKIIGFQYVPVACLESYRSHRGYSGSFVSKTPARKKPPIPAPDFEKEFHHL